MTTMGGDWEPASVRGRLVEKGWGTEMGYPGLIIDDHGEEIRGFVFSSSRLAEQWTDLDAFEGDEYERVVTNVTLAGGEQIEAHVYVLRAG